MHKVPKADINLILILRHEKPKGFMVKSPTFVCLWKPSVFFFTLGCISDWNNHLSQYFWISPSGSPDLPFCLSPTCHFAILFIYKFLDMNLPKKWPEMAVKWPTHTVVTFICTQTRTATGMDGTLPHISFGNLKPVEISKNCFNFIWTTLKVL